MTTPSLAPRACRGSIEIVAAVVVWALLAARPAAADFVELERLLDAPSAKLAEQLEGAAVVVAVRDGSHDTKPWNLAQAAGVELTAALRRRHIDAIRAAADARLDELEAVDRPFTARQTKSLKRADRDAIVGMEWVVGKKPQLKLSAFIPDSLRPVWSGAIDLPEAALSQEKNIPPMNRAVVKFAQQALGTPVRDGDCTHLAEDCLKAAGTGKRGVYRWGRGLAPREPWLPGDILQMERFSVTAPGFARGFDHHTAVLEEVHFDRVVVLHQNAFPEGKLVQRETWPIAGMVGPIVAYRPWDWPADNPFPPAWPLRVSPPLIVREGSGKKPQAVDLLKLVDPRLDRVQGIWFFEKGNLRSPCEFEARLQVPVKPPKSYRLRTTVERMQGVEQFGIGIVAGGRQTMLSIDGFERQFTGIHYLDGKSAKENESTKSGTFLPLHRRVEVECRVRKDAIQLDIDKQAIIDWRGDAARLSLPPEWSAPHADWLFISAYNSEFDVSAFTLEASK